MKVEPYERVAAIMTTPAITVGPEATLRQVAAALRDANVGALVVLGDGRPMGMVSERDVVRALADGGDPDEVWAADVESEQPRYVTPWQLAPRVAEEMLVAGVRHLPVVDEGEVIGVVGIRDALRSMTKTVLTAQAAAELPLGPGELVRELSHLGG